MLIIHIYRTDFELCVEEMKEKKKKEQNENFYAWFSLQWERLMELLEYILQWNSQVFSFVSLLRYSAVGILELLL